MWIDPPMGWIGGASRRPRRIAERVLPEYGNGQPRPWRRGSLFSALRPPAKDSAEARIARRNVRLVPRRNVILEADGLLVEVELGPNVGLR
jgi:hypothetical protein